MDQSDQRLRFAELTKKTRRRQGHDQAFIRMRMESVKKDPKLSKSQRQAILQKLGKELSR
jgi:hypothetical protein